MDEFAAPAVDDFTSPSTLSDREVITSVTPKFRRYPSMV